MSTHEFYEIARMAVARALAVDLPCLLMDRSRVRFAETRCRLNKRVQNGLQIEGRAADADSAYRAGRSREWVERHLAVTFDPVRLRNEDQRSLALFRELPRRKD